MAPRSSSAMAGSCSMPKRTTTGGTGLIRYSPSTWWHSLSSACTLVCRYALWMSALRRRTALRDCTASNSWDT